MPIKKRLATISDTSWRYTVVKAWWGEKSLKKIRVCKFYSWLFPTSVIMTALAIIMMCGIVIPATWFFGSTSVLIKDRGAGPVKDGFYAYKYSPHNGRYRHFAPWQIGIPVMVALGLAYGWATGWLYDQRFVFLYGAGAAVSVVLAFYLLHSIIRRNKSKLRQFWDRNCTTLTVIHEATKDDALT